MRLNFLFLLSIFFILTSCASKISLANNYFDSAKKVGIIQINNPINNYREGSQGLLDIAVTQGDKYAKGLQIVDMKLNANEEVYNAFKKIYSDKGKDLLIIDFDLNFKQLNTFSKPKGSKKKYYKYNIKFLKEKYNIDELLLVDTHYGLLISYYGFIEISRFGHCQISPLIIDLNDNSLLFKDKTIINKPLRGKWNTPPNYENLNFSINSAVQEAIRNQRVKFQ